jgi:WD40 repeat protein
MKPTHLLYIALVLLSACAPVNSPTVADPQSQAATATSALEPVQPTLTAVPAATATPAPQFPLSLDESLPAFAPISVENASQLRPVASVDTELISEVFLTEKQDKILLNTTFGVQVIDRATFSAGRYLPQSGIIFGREFPPDGRRMAQIMPGNPKLFDVSLAVTDLETGKTICTYSPLDLANSQELVLYPDGSLSYITSNGQPNRILRWDNGCHVTFNEEARWPVLDISDDGTLAVLGDGNELYVHTTAGFSRNKLGEFSNLRGAYFLPDGKSILVTTQAGNAIYELDGGTKTHDFPGNMGKSFTRYRPSQDGQWVLISGDKINRALRLSDYAIFALPADYMNLTDNPLNKGFEQLAKGYLVTKDYLWDIEKQGKVASLKKYGAWMYDKTILISSDRTRAAASPNAEPHYIDILDLSTGKLLFTIPDYHTPLALPDGTGFIATFQGKTAFFDYSSDQPLAVIDLNYTEGLVLENGDLLVWDNLGNLYQLDPAARSLLHSTRLPFVLSNASPQNLAPAWAQGREYPFDDFLAAFMTPRWSQWVVSHNLQIGLREVSAGVVQLFKMRENSQSWQFVLPEDVISTSTPGDVYEMTFSPDDRFAAGVLEKKLIVWDTATGKELRSIALPVPAGAVNDFEFSPDGSKLLVSNEKSTRDFSASIHTDATLRIFDVQTGRQLKFFDLKQTFRKSGCNIGLPFVLSADGTQMISISENCRLGIFDTSTWELKQEFHDPFQDANIDLALSPDNRLLAVAYRNKLELWDWAAGTMVKSYSNTALLIYPPHRDAELGYIYQVAFSPDGSLLGTRFSGEFGMTYNSIITLWGIP